MKLYKKTIALLLALLLLAGSAVSESVSLFASETESDFSRSRRVISLVYDDSSSMDDLDQAKALNTAYAVENFISLLDPWHLPLHYRIPSEVQLNKRTEA